MKPIIQWKIIFGSRNNAPIDDACQTILLDFYHIRSPRFFFFFQYLLSLVTVFLAFFFAFSEAFSVRSLRASILGGTCPPAVFGLWGDRIIAPPLPPL